MKWKKKWNCYTLQVLPVEKFARIFTKIINGEAGYRKMKKGD